MVYEMKNKIKSKSNKFCV